VEKRVRDVEIQRPVSGKSEGSMWIELLQNRNRSGRGGLRVGPIQRFTSFVGVIHVIRCCSMN
jgi:hypothetical protein